MVDYVIREWKTLLEWYVWGCFVWAFIAGMGNESLKDAIVKIVLWPIILAATIGGIAGDIVRKVRS